MLETLLGSCPQLQLCNGLDENAIGTCAELIFAPMDSSFADDAPVLPSGFRIIPLDSGLDSSSPNCTLDLASAFEVGQPRNRAPGEYASNGSSLRSVMTIAFQFAFESHLQENVASMARQYVRSIVSSVQRVALALSPSNISPHSGLRPPPGSPEAQTLAHWISNSYRRFMGAELLKSNGEASESILNTLWHQSDAIMCCSIKATIKIVPSHLMDMLSNYAASSGEFHVVILITFHCMRYLNFYK